MKFLNLGCGNHYSNATEWTNLDFVSFGVGVIAHNLLKGIPFQNNKFDLVYHSHVLEHFTKEDGEKLILECIRVLKPGGTLRIAIPDLEHITKKYLSLVDRGIENPVNTLIKANYDWMLIEMYDQTVRNQSGGLMLKYLSQESLINENFVFERIGAEGREIRETYLLLEKNKSEIINTSEHSLGIRTKIKNLLKIYIFYMLKIDLKAYQTGKFRMEGEIHQWMYDRYSLTCLLKSCGADKIQIRDAFTSYIDNWADYYLDGKDDIVRKPDSLFIEAIK